MDVCCCYHPFTLPGHVYAAHTAHAFLPRYLRCVRARFTHVRLPALPRLRVGCSVLTYVGCGCLHRVLCVPLWRVAFYGLRCRYFVTRAVTLLRVIAVTVALRLVDCCHCYRLRLPRFARVVHPGYLLRSDLDYIRFLPLRYVDLLRALPRLIRAPVYGVTALPVPSHVYAAATPRYRLLPTVAYRLVTRACSFTTDSVRYDWFVCGCPLTYPYCPYPLFLRLRVRWLYV